MSIVNVEVLKLANRGTGTWLPHVELCKNRVLPCGNPYCADEAMRAVGVKADKGQVGRIKSRIISAHALDLANDCDNPDCPLEIAVGRSRVEAVGMLIGEEI